MLRILLGACALVSGCSAPPIHYEPPVGHPASASADEAPIAPASPTLAHEGATTSAPAPAPSPATADPDAPWVCPMHEEVTAARPGDCPKCGMKLVERRER